MSLARPRPGIIVTLAARDGPSARREAQEALEDGADLAEVRLDRWSAVDRTKLGALFPSPLGLVATLRSTAEGGEGPDTPAERTAELTRMAGYPFHLLDVEFARDWPLDERIASVLRRSGAPGLLLSAHLLRDARFESARALLERTVEPPGAVKLVLHPDWRTLLDEVIPKLPNPEGSRYVVHSVGPTGPLLRAWARRLGMTFVFAGPGSARARAPVEPSQLPVDALAHYWRGDALGPLFAVVGHPVGHSASPELHRRWMQSIERTGLYLTLDVPDATTLASLLGPLAEGGFRGLNLTHPLKTAALALADRASRAAEEVGAANLLTFHDGATEAENTDLPALLRRIRELHEVALPGLSVVTILGAGGAARAAAVASRTLGLRTEMVARRPDRARSVADRLGATVRDPALGPTAELLIHATPAGRSEEPRLDVPLDRLLGPGTYVLDLVYRPHHRVLEEHTRARGGRYEDGLRVLAYQAATSFELWWDRAPSDAALDDALGELR